MLWGTITNRIPALRDYCEKIIGQHYALNQNCIEIPELNQDIEPEHEHGHEMKF